MALPNRRSPTRQLSRVSPPTSGNGAASPYPCAPFVKVTRRKTFSAIVRVPVATTKGSVMGTSTGQNSILRMVTDMSCIGMKGALLLIEGVCQEFIELDTVMDIGNLNVVGHQVQQPYFGGWYRRVIAPDTKVQMRICPYAPMYQG